MTLRLRNITLDCTDPPRMAQFWSEALGRPIDDGASAHFASIGQHEPGQTGWFFIKVPEARTAKNRVHADLQTDDREAEVARLLALGAQRVGEYDEWGARWTTLRDVEGNEFCVTGTGQ
jgi:predicted enzyme related to lactoylglutathione lyase